MWWPDPALAGVGTLWGSVYAAALGRGVVVVVCTSGSQVLLALVSLRRYTLDYPGPCVAWCRTGLPELSVLPQMGRLRLHQEHGEVRAASAPL